MTTREDHEKTEGAGSQKEATRAYWLVGNHLTVLARPRSVEATFGTGSWFVDTFSCWCRTPGRRRVLLKCHPEKPPFFASLWRLFRLYG
jgi:hypothetical protein